ncbi:MAG: antA/AntB antirepressor family protein [Gemmatimonadaceae bacterium]
MSSKDHNPPIFSQEASDQLTEEAREMIKRGPRKRKTIRSTLESYRSVIAGLREQGYTVPEIACLFEKHFLRQGIELNSLAYLAKVISQMNEKPRYKEQPAPAAEPQDNLDGLVAVSSGVIGGLVVQTVDARELHAFLGVGKVFRAWIQDRIQQFGFVENQDFVCIENVCRPNSDGKGRGGHNVKEYTLTLDMAKELSMVERTPKGKEARQYFIECERRLYAGEAAPTRSGRAMEDADLLSAAESPSKTSILDHFLPVPFHDFLSGIEDCAKLVEITHPNASAEDKAREAVHMAAGIMRIDLAALRRIIGDRGFLASLLGR